MVVPGTDKHTDPEIYNLLELKEGDPIITRQDLRNLTSDIEPNKCYTVERMVIEVSAEVSGQIGRHGEYNGKKTKYNGQSEFNLSDVKKAMIKVYGNDNYFPSQYFKL